MYPTIRHICLTALSLVLVAGCVAHAGGRRANSVSMGWGVAVPSGSNSFANKTSWVSPAVAWEYRFIPVLSAGLSVGYASFDEQAVTRDRYDGDLTDGYTDRTLSLTPVQAVLRYQPLGAGTSQWQPYVSLAGGMQYARYRIEGDQIPASGKEEWAAVVTPAVGLRYYACQRLWFDLSGSWQWSNSEWNLLNVKSTQNFRVGISVGFDF